MKYLIVGLMVGLLIFSGIAYAAMPKYISVQGRLSDSEGPLTGSYDFYFKIDDDAAGCPSPAWSEERDDGINLDNGVFNVLIGTDTPIDDVSCRSIDEDGKACFEVKRYLCIGVREHNVGEYDWFSTSVPISASGYAYAADEFYVDDDLNVEGSLTVGGGWGGTFGKAVYLPSHSSDTAKIVTEQLSNARTKMVFYISDDVIDSNAWRDSFIFRAHDYRSGGIDRDILDINWDGLYLNADYGIQWTDPTSGYNFRLGNFYNDGRANTGWLYLSDGAESYSNLAVGTLYASSSLRAGYLPNCSATTGKLYTDATGKILCGTDQTGGGSSLWSRSSSILTPVNTGDIISTAIADSYDKIRVYPSAPYSIGMKSAQTFGGLNDWAMTFTMNNDADRGWLWRDDADGASGGAMSLTTGGILTVASDLTVGGLVKGAKDISISMKNDDGYAYVLNKAGTSYKGLAAGILHSGTGEIQLVDTNTTIQEGSGNAVRIRTDSGYGDIGPQNTGYFHFTTSTPKFWFEKEVRFAGPIIPYGGAQNIGSSGSPWGTVYANDVAVPGVFTEYAGGGTQCNSNGQWYPPATWGVLSYKSCANEWVQVKCPTGSYLISASCDCDNNYIEAEWISGASSTWSPTGLSTEYTCICHSSTDKVVWITCGR